MKSPNQIWVINIHYLFLLIINGLSGDELDDPKELLLSNMTQVASSRPNGSLDWQCTICSKLFDRKRKCQNHVESMHFRGIITHTCDRCGAVFDTFYKMQHHRKKRSCGDEILISNMPKSDVDYDSNPLD